MEISWIVPCAAIGIEPEAPSSFIPFMGYSLPTNKRLTSPKVAAVDPNRNLIMVKCCVHGTEGVSLIAINIKINLDIFR